MSTWASIIDQAFVDLTVIQPGETLTTTLQNEAFARLIQLISSLSTEGLTVFNQAMQAFGLSSGVTAYTLGVGGSFATALRAQKVTAWRGIGTTATSGGAPLGMSEFGAMVSQADQGIGIQSSIPKFVGADTSYPLINVRVWPTPSISPGSLELAYWTPITAPAAVGETVSLPSGYERMIQLNLAMDLAPAYARPGQTLEVLAAQAQNAKASIVQQNSMATQQGAQ